MRVGCCVWGLGLRGGGRGGGRWLCRPCSRRRSSTKSSSLLASTWSYIHWGRRSSGASLPLVDGLISITSPAVTNEDGGARETGVRYEAAARPGSGWVRRAAACIRRARRHTPPWAMRCGRRPRRAGWWPRCLLRMVWTRTNRRRAGTAPAGTWMPCAGSLMGRFCPRAEAAADRRQSHRRCARSW